MKKLISMALSIALVSILVLSCSKSSEDEVAPPPPPPGGGGNTCDTVNMTYTADVKPLLQSNCYGCHGNGQTSGGVTLDTYAGVKTVVDNNKLMGVVTHASGFPAMPKGGAKLSDCNINKIKSWIGRGAQNN